VAISLVLLAQEALGTALLNHHLFLKSLAGAFLIVFVFEDTLRLKQIRQFFHVVLPHVAATCV